jgi:hypothetical protein
VSTRCRYQRFLEKDARTEGLVSRQQLQAKMLQLQKVINHPKCILLTLERERQAARLLQKRAEGSQYIATPAVLAPPTAAAQAMEDELRRLHGGGLIRASGKLHLLDRLLFRVRAQGSRVLLFSQYTLTLDVLSEYCAVRFGPEGRGFLRLDGSTNRIKREMDVRKFNAEGSRIPVYLISTRAGGQGINLATADVVRESRAPSQSVGRRSWIRMRRREGVLGGARLPDMVLSGVAGGWGAVLACTGGAVRHLLEPSGRPAGAGPRTPHWAEEAGQSLPADRGVHDGGEGAEARQAETGAGRAGDQERWRRWPGRARWDGR